MLQPLRFKATAIPRNAWVAILAIRLAGAVLSSAATSPAIPLPVGVPTLDEMAGDWKTPGELEQFPSIHNFNGQMLVNKDLASISWLASPPFSQGFHSGALKLDGRVPVAGRFRWYPYQAVRSGALAGLAIETVNRMVFDGRGVLWRITVSNTQPGELSGKLSLDLIGAISKLTAVDSWDWAYAQPGPGGPKRRYEETEAIRAAVDATPPPRLENAADYTATVGESDLVLVVSDTKSSAKTVFAFARKPDPLTSDGHQGLATWEVRLAGGETKTIDLVMAFGEGAGVTADASRWAGRFLKATRKTRSAKRWRRHGRPASLW